MALAVVDRFTRLGWSPRAAVGAVVDLGGGAVNQALLA
jgi:hypothetical protein